MVTEHWICGVCYPVESAWELYGKGKMWGMTLEEAVTHGGQTGHGVWWHYSYSP